MTHEQLRSRPPTRVLRAFGAHGPAAPLPGGRGLAWRAGSIVIKPADATEEALAWQATVLEGAPIDGVRVALPLRSTDGSYVVDGWMASSFVAGRHARGRWLEVIAAGERLHAALADIGRPDFIDARDDPWSNADRAAWGDIPLTPFLAAPHVERLAALLSPVGTASQVIHGDLTGNVLFAEPLPPAIIDFAVYWRPAGYATAIVVADGLAWEGATVGDFGEASSGPGFGPLLARALLFRIVTDWLADAGEAATRATAYASGVSLAATLVERAHTERIDRPWRLNRGDDPRAAPAGEGLERD
jgi:uncharacterized protein (TIGR02569 family)